MFKKISIFAFLVLVLSLAFHTVAAQKSFHCEGISVTHGITLHLTVSKNPANDERKQFHAHMAGTGKFKPVFSTDNQCIDHIAGRHHLKLIEGQHESDERGKHDVYTDFLYGQPLTLHVGNTTEAGNHIVAIFDHLYFDGNPQTFTIESGSHLKEMDVFILAHDDSFDPEIRLPEQLIHHWTTKTRRGEFTYLNFCADVGNSCPIAGGDYSSHFVSWKRSTGGEHSVHMKQKDSMATFTRSSEFNTLSDRQHSITLTGSGKGYYMLVVALTCADHCHN